MGFFRALSRFVRGSLRAKVTLGVVLPLVLILVIFTTVEYKRHQEVILSNLSSLAWRYGKVIDSNLRHAMLGSDFSELQTILDSVAVSDEFHLIYLMDTNGRVIFAPHGQGVGKQLNKSQLDCKPCHRLDPKERPSSAMVTADDGQRVYRSIYPIKNAPECSQCHDPNRQLIGLLLTDFPVSPMEEALAGGFRENLIWWVGTILVTIVVVNLAMSRIVVQRLARLVHALSHFGQERLDSHLPVGDLDEIGQLTKAYNTMGQQIEAEAAANRSLSDHLHRQNTQRGELLKHLITAQEDERKRVSREIHDDFGQALGALSLQAQVLERLIASDTQDAIEQLGQIQNLINETTERMYDLILALRPSALDELGLVAALRTHAERNLDGSGIRFELSTDSFSGRLPADMETALYRIFQEALNNVRRHSGAKQVRITLALHADSFVGEIYDDGVGFDPQVLDFNENSPRGLGLLSIRERVDQCCGQVEIISRPGRGTRILVRFPIFEVDCG